jgi:GNAT superfamily N-acetyltransferase
MDKDTVTIRELSPEELGNVRDLGKRAFSLPMGLSMAATMSPQGLVAEDATGAIIGALTLRTESVGGRKLGIPDWAVVDPQHQGKGIGKALGDQALVWFRQQGCDKVVTTGVDGYNSASWNMAHSRGLRYWPVSQQIREFGWRWPKLLFVIPHTIGVSTFILQLPLNEQEQLDTPTTGGVGALIGVTLFLGFFLLLLSRVRAVLWRSTAVPDLLAPLNPTAVFVGVGIVATYMSIRAVSHWLAARALRLPLIFRLWDSGLITATLLAAGLGLFIPGLGGSYYVRQTRFNYSRAHPAMGKTMLAGVAASLALLTVFTLWTGLGATPGVITTLGCYVGVSFGLTDTLFFFSPFQALPAGHLWRWRRAVWLAVFVCFLGIWLVLPRILS